MYLDTKFNSSKADLGLLGDYPGSTRIQGADVVVTDDDVLTNPFELSIKNKDGSTTKPRINIGMRLKLAVITLHFDYTYANYSVATAGFGIWIR